MRRLTIALIATAVLVGCGNGESAEPEQDATTEAENASLNLRIAAECHSDLAVTDDGTSLIVNTHNRAGGPRFPRALGVLDCVYEGLEMPESVIAHIGRTRALDGTQEASWGSLQASWTYHPDSGLSLIVELGEGES